MRQTKNEIQPKIDNKDLNNLQNIPPIENKTILHPPQQDSFRELSIFKNKASLKKKSAYN